jgi:hypothetical protein
VCGLIEGLSRHLSGGAEENHAEPVSGYDSIAIHLCRSTRSCVITSRPICFTRLIFESRQTGCLNRPGNSRSMHNGTPGLMDSFSLTEGKTELVSH